MKKFFASAIVGLLLTIAVSVFAQEGVGNIKKLIQEQEALLVTMRLYALHLEITHAAGRMIQAWEQYRLLELKIQRLSDDHATLCMQFPTLPYRQTLHEIEASTAQVVALMDQIPAHLAAGAVPSEGMKKLLEGEFSSLVQGITAGTVKLQSLFSELETSCSKEG